MLAMDSGNAGLAIYGDGSFTIDGTSLHDHDFRDLNNLLAYLNDIGWLITEDVQSQRAALFSEVDIERCHQQALYSPAYDDDHQQAEWIALLTRHLGLAVDEGCQGERCERFRRQMVKVAALAMAALEAHDRKYSRTTGPVPTGSGW
jgi:hypothetical protein